MVAHKSEQQQIFVLEGPLQYLSLLFVINITEGLWASS